MPIIWLFVLYFIVKSSYWKKFIIYLCFIFLLITSLPIVSTYIAKLFYSDNYKISNYSYLDKLNRSEKINYSLEIN